MHFFWKGAICGDLFFRFLAVSCSFKEWFLFSPIYIKPPKFYNSYTKEKNLLFPLILYKQPHILLKKNAFKSLQMFQLNNPSAMLFFWTYKYLLRFGCCCTYFFFTSLLIASWNEQWQKIYIMSTRVKIYNRKVYKLFISSFFSIFLNN